ncbi:ribonuclease HI family protein [Patescibacteria group bacterium]|nr:ribonuclease HI family protein [Patescibacteria group bacterium]MBU1256192.1 ribonuclease HI family protein [Patescibacteria group bacterium]MBU1457667.1 ribonuclease HI family protein [Patescibacteria group bacterium]
MQKINNLNIYTDGGSRGNPGPAAIGVYAHPLFQLSEPIGETTNNVAEYTAPIKALEYLVKNNIQAKQINFYLDSELVVKQIKGEYKVKQPHLQTLALQAHQLLRQLKSSQISFHYIPREQNKLADALVNQALDTHSK